MERIRGRVVSVSDDLSHAFVEVSAARPCARCANGKGCGAGIFGADGGPWRIEATVAGAFEVQVGDDVQIELAPKNLWRAALTVYGLPLAAALLASGVAYFAGLSDGESVLAVAAGVAIAVLVVRQRLRRSACLRRFVPAITSRHATAG